jgi:uncharacterized protein (DUF433 family)
MASASTQWKYLERDPKSSYRQLSIKGRGIKARTLYGLHVNAEEPMSVEELAADWHLPVEAVEEAIAYCRTKPKEIELDQLEEELRMKLSGRDRPHRDQKSRILTSMDRAAIQKALDEAVS